MNCRYGSSVVFDEGMFSKDILNESTELSLECNKKLLLNPKRDIKRQM